MRQASFAWAGKILCSVLLLPLVQITALSRTEPRPLHVVATNRFAPLIEYLNTQIADQRFEIVATPFNEMVAAAKHREIDFVLAAPTHFVTLDVEVGVTAIATLRDSVRPGTFTNFIGGAVFCRTGEASIRQLRDLRGKRFAAVDPLALGGWISAGRELLEEGIDLQRDIRVEFQFTPEAVVDAVRRGLTDAGVLATGKLESFLDSGLVKPGEFRVLPPREIYPESMGFPLLYSTRLYPQTAFTALPHIPEPLMRRIAIALLRLPEEGEVARSTGSAGWSLPIGYQSVHRAMQELQSGPYKDFGKVTLASALRQQWEKALIALLALSTLLTVIVLRMVRLNRSLSDSRAALQKEFELHRISQEKRLESEARFRSVFENSAVGIYITTPGGRIIDSNAAFLSMLGYSREELEVLDVEILNHLADRDLELLPAQELLAGQRNSYELDKRCLRKGGEAVWVHFTGSLVRDTRGQVIMSIGMAEEITQRRQAEEERERLITELQAALREVQTLRGLLPICANCKKIRDDQGYWKQVEVFIQERSQVQFSHGICPACMQALYPEYSHGISHKS